MSYVQCTACDWDGWRKRTVDPSGHDRAGDKPCPAKRRDGTICGARVGLA